MFPSTELYSAGTAFAGVVDLSDGHEPDVPVDGTVLRRNVREVPAAFEDVCGTVRVNALLMPEVMGEVLREFEPQLPVQSEVGFV